MKQSLIMGFFLLFVSPMFSQTEIGINFPVSLISFNNTSSSEGGSEFTIDESTVTSNMDIQVFFSIATKKNFNWTHKMGFSQNYTNATTTYPSNNLIIGSEIINESRIYDFIFALGVEKKLGLNKIDFIYGCELPVSLSPKHETIETRNYYSTETAISSKRETIAFIPATYSTGIILTGKIFHYFNRLGVGLNTSSGLGLSYYKGTFLSETKVYDSNLVLTSEFSDEYEDKATTISPLYSFEVGFRYKLSNPEN